VSCRGVRRSKADQDDVVVHGKGMEHDRLEALFQRLQECNITLRKAKCKLGMSQVKWFGHIYSKQGMSAAPAKVEMIQAWPRPTDKSEVKSFLQTVQFCFHETKTDSRTTDLMQILHFLCVVSQSKAQNSNGHKNARTASKN